MTADTEKARLSQDALLKELTRSLQATEMVTVYLSDSDGPKNHGIYCALVPTADIEKSLSSPSWDLMHESGYPGAVQYYEDGETVTEYYRFGDGSGVEPLVIDRGFYGMRPDYKELSEEFWLFHRLYHDRQSDQYIKIDDDGNETVVAIVEPNRIQIRLKELRQFLAIKEMHLAILFDCREHSMMSLDELGLTESGEDKRDGLVCWGLNYGDIGGIGGHRAFSRLLGKRLIEPLPKEKSGIWGFAEEEPKKYVEFIIGVDDDGNEVSFTSNPDELANYFGANPEAPNYLTPVSFRKEVLNKYYQQPGKYNVSDGVLGCGYLWSMYLDNHHDDKVCAWLGDLGRDLPYEDQLHWRSHNIASPDGVSETYYRRQMLAQFTDSDRPEHVFQVKYGELAKISTEVLGWRLLLPLAPEDEHHFQCVRVPATDEQRDFDELVLGLTKILIDSLNEKSLNSLVPKDQLPDLKGSISRLEAALAACGIEGAEGHIAFLRKLQSLRSSGSAHRKGSNYRKIATEFGVDSQNLRAVYRGILGRALGTLEFLVDMVRSGKFGASAT